MTHVHELAEARATIVGLERTLAATQAHLDDVRRERDHLAAALHPRLVLPADPAEGADPLGVREAFGRVFDKAALYGITHQREPCCDAAAKVKRVRELADAMDGLAGMTFNGEPFPPAVTLADLRAALDGPATGTGSPEQ